MTEISLNVLDISRDSAQANASLVTILVTADTSTDKLAIIIADNGYGIAPGQAVYVVDPSFTTRTTQKIGLGISFFKYAAGGTDSSFHIESEPDKRTIVTAVLGLFHIDRIPLGDMNATIYNLIMYHPDTDFPYTYTYNDTLFTLDIKQMREILGGIPSNIPEVSAYIMEYLKENQ